MIDEIISKHFNLRTKYIHMLSRVTLTKDFSLWKLNNKFRLDFYDDNS